MRAVLTVAATLALALASPALAETEPRAEVTTQVTYESYRGQMLIADAVSFGLVAAAPNGPLLLIGGAGFLLTGPAMHDGAPRALGSLALRVGLPALSMYVAKAKRDCSQPLSCDVVGGMPEGLLFGMVAAIAIDTIFIARPVRVEHKPPPIMPTVSALDRGAAVGVSGAF